MKDIYQANGSVDMKSVRLTIRPGDTAVHPVYALITGGADYLSTVEVINWNVSDESVGLLHRIEGDREAFAADLDEILDRIETEIEEIGCEVSQDAILAQLSDRQQAAIVAGIGAGYYEIPRQATHADVARMMGCASSTASEHIKKAESKIVTALFARLA
jgi:predicted DNA binding protein